MNAAIEIRKTPDGRILARRKDGKPLTPEDREHARRLHEAQPPVACLNVKVPAVDRIVDDRAIAVLIDSTVLGAPIWFAFKDGWTPEQTDGVPIFYAGELSALRQKTADQLCSIFNIKRTYGGGMLRQ